MNYDEMKQKLAELTNTDASFWDFQHTEDGYLTHFEYQRGLVEGFGTAEDFGNGEYSFSATLHYC